MINARCLAAIIINVSGRRFINCQNSNMNDIMNNANIRSKVIWNFYEATSIDLNSQKFVGALLAPYATVTQTGGNIYGSVGVLSLITNAEVHLSTDVDVNIPTDVVSLLALQLKCLNQRH